VTSEDAIFLGLGSTGALLARAWLLPPILLATEFRALTNAQRQLISVRELLPAPVSVVRLCLPFCLLRVLLACCLDCSTFLLFQFLIDS
jgi:hypothetical protein